MALPDVTTERLRLSRWDPALHTPALEAINARPEAVTLPQRRRPVHAGGDRSAVRAVRRPLGYVRLRPLGRFDARAPVTCIGFVGVTHPLWFPALSDQVEVGWRLHPSHWGHGFATEAGRAAVAAARTSLGWNA